MKKRIVLKGLIVLSAFLFQVNFVIAQEQQPVENYDQGFRLGFGLNARAPLQNPYEMSLGADARIQYDFTKKTSLTLTTGFTNLFVEGDANDLGYIPAKLGFKAFVLKDKFYLMGEAGAAFAVTNNYDKTSFLWSPSIGYATNKIDISLKYENFNDFPIIRNNVVENGLGIVSLRLAYGFKL